MDAQLCPGRIRICLNFNFKNQFMKNIFLGITLFLMASLPITAQHNTNDKEFLLNYFEETIENLENEIRGLSKAQMHFKPSKEKWSVSQCVEHIVLTEKMLFDMNKSEMKKPQNPERKGEVKVKDENLIKEMKDRSQKFETSDELVGSGKYDSPEEAIAEMKRQREFVLDYIKKTPLEDFRNQISDSPYGPIDAYQSMLFLAGHTARHTLQIKEVKADINFPLE